MDQAIEFLSRHGTLVLVGLIFAGGIGLPIPAPPVLLAAGVLAGSGKFSLGIVFGGSVLALLATDLLWYELGRRYGRRILALLCRISLEPDSCVQRTEDLFARRQAAAVLVSKFIPGLKTAAPPLAGMLRMRVPTFVLSDAAGTLLWIGAFMAVGFLFSDQVARAVQVSKWLVTGAGVAFAAWLAWKYFDRWRFLRQLRIGRVTPDELHAQLAAGDDVVVVDLRHPVELQMDGTKVAGAVQMTPDEVERRHEEIPRDRDLVLYCSCPSEAAAASVALMLRQRGLTRVRPLLGGIDAWRARGYPVEAVQIDEADRLPVAQAAGSR
jgi:membrane protein DedA with SNARE-associated domain/rhodanese-related sulfurtransferase